MPFSWEPNSCLVTVSDDDDHALFPSDLPKVDGYSDMTKIDLYAFYEPAYHWVNLKRNAIIGPKPMMHVAMRAIQLNAERFMFNPSDILV